MINRVTTILLALFLAACGDSSAPSQTDSPASSTKPADYVFTNARVYTVNPDQEWAEAVAVRGKEIVYVGDNAGASAFAGDGTEVVDLGGRMVMPGMVESHIHLGIGAATTSGVILGPTDTLEGVLRKVKEYADAHPEKATIFGASYLAGIFDERGGDKALLDEIVPDRPVYLLDHTVHGAWVNSKALEMAGITKDTPDPAGGEYIRDEHGEPTGAIKGGPAHVPIAVATSAITAESSSAALPNVVEGLTELGFTSAIDMGAPIATPQVYEAMYDLSKAGELPLRLSVAYYINTPKLAETAVETMHAYAQKYRTDTLWFDTLKVTADSVIETQKGAMLEPYLSTGDRGALYFDREALGKMMLGAAELGYNGTVHTIGGMATRTALQVAHDLREAGYDTLYSTTHSQMVHPDDRKMYVDYDVTAQTTGNWAVVLPDYRAHISKEVLETRQFPLRWWEDNSVNVALGSDWPATPGGFEIGVNAFNNIYSAMHRTPPPGLAGDLGSVEGEVLPPEEQLLTLAEALRAYTLGGAIMLGIDDQVGTIEVGKKADLIMLSQNVFEVEAKEIPETKVLATMFDGRIVHDVTLGLGDPNVVDVSKYSEFQVNPAHSPE